MIGALRVNYYAMNLFISTNFCHYIINNTFLTIVLRQKQNRKPERKFGKARYNNTLKTIKVLLDFSLTVKAATLILISGRGSAISSAKEGKSGSIYNLIKS